MESSYDLELSNVVKQIKKQKSKSVLIQLPDGLKPRATEIVDYLQENTDANILIWQETCFGACDTPNVDEKSVDLVVQFGHSKFL